MGGLKLAGHEHRRPLPVSPPPPAAPPAEGYQGDAYGDGQPASKPMTQTAPQKERRSDHPRRPLNPQGGEAGDLLARGVVVGRDQARRFEPPFARRTAAGWRS